jgi:hypothetical protein
MAVLVICSFGTETEASSAEFCKWLGDNLGYYCDDPIARALWRTYQSIVNDVHNCNDLCVKVAKKSSGQCVDSGNYDTSTWCPRGQTCKCFQEKQ